LEFRPGTASTLIPKAGREKEWITSLEWICKDTLENWGKNSGWSTRISLGEPGKRRLDGTKRESIAVEEKVGLI